MTITTAERADAGARKALRLAPLALAAMLMSAECRADWKIVPQVDLRETYTDNVGQEPNDRAHSSWISEAIPSVALVGRNERYQLTANAQYHAYAYSDTEAPNLRNNDYQYNAQGQAALIRELLFVDGAASRSRQAISAFGPLQTNLYSNFNNTEVSSWRISPYLQHRFGTTADLTLRYSRDSLSGGTDGFGDSMASTRTAELASGARFHELGWNLSYYHQDLNQQFTGQSSMENSTAGLHWLVQRTLALTATLGYDKFEYPALNSRTNGRSWTVGFDWEPSTRTSVKLTYGRRYFGKTGSLASLYRTQHTIWSLNYSDQVTTSRSQFLLPAAYDTASMLDRLFASAFPDAVERQQAVQAYIAQLGLPATLRDNINFLSNRYERDRHLQGSLTFKGARSSLALSMFADRRNALSIQQSDSVLLGNQLANLNDNVKQHGASASFDYRLSSRSTVAASVYKLHSLSLDTNTVNNSLDSRLTLTRTFNDKVRGSAELRHVRGDLGWFNGQPYTENAIAAMISVQY